MTEKKKHKSAGGKKMQTLSNRVAPLAPGGLLAGDMQQYMRGNGVQAPADLGGVEEKPGTTGLGLSPSGNGGKGIYQIPQGELKILDTKATPLYKPEYYELERVKVPVVVNDGCDFGDPNIKGGKIALYEEAANPAGAGASGEALKSPSVPEGAPENFEVASTLKAASKVIKRFTPKL